MAKTKSKEVTSITIPTMTIRQMNYAATLGNLWSPSDGLDTAIARLSYVWDLRKQNPTTKKVGGHTLRLRTPATVGHQWTPEQERIRGLLSDAQNASTPEAKEAARAALLDMPLPLHVVFDLRSMGYEEYCRVATHIRPGDIYQDTELPSVDLPAYAPEEIEAELRRSYTYKLSEKEIVV